LLLTNFFYYWGVQIQKKTKKNLEDLKIGEK